MTAALEAVMASQLGPVQRGRLYRKIDLHVIPLMFLCYFYQFLDKVRRPNEKETERMERWVGVTHCRCTWLTRTSP